MVRHLSMESSFNERCSHPSLGGNFISSKYTHAAQSIRVTRMLVLVSSCFLILNAPAHIFLIVIKIHTSINTPVHSNHLELEYFQQTKNLTKQQLQQFVYIDTSDQRVQLTDGDSNSSGDQIMVHLLYIAILFAQLISYASYSMNFFLYSLSGMAFRTSLRQLLAKIRRH